MTIKNKGELKSLMQRSQKDGRLITPKHDPYQTRKKLYSYDTSVISKEVADKIEVFITSGDFTADIFVNTEYLPSPLYVVITPGADSNFSVPASGISSYSLTPSYPLDRLVLVSGTTQGLHIFGECSSIIEEKLAEGTLTLSGRLK